MNRFDQALLGAVNHLQRLRLICADGNDQAAAHCKLLKQRSGHFWRSSRHQNAVEGGFVWPARIAVAVAQRDVAQRHGG